MPSSNYIDVWLDVGQSNIDGESSIALHGMPTPAQPDGTVPGFIMYNNSTGRWANWQYGVNNGAFSNTGLYYSFDVYAFNNYKVAKGISTMYLVKATRGSTCLAPNANSVSTMSPRMLQANLTAVPAVTLIFGNLKSRIQGAIAINARAGYDTRFKGMIVHQGEGDSLEPYASAYQANALEFIADVRNLTGNQTLEIYWGTVPPNSTQYSATVKQALFNIETLDSHFHVVDLPVLTPLDQGVHWTYVDQEFVGTKYSDLMIQHS